MSSLFPCFQLVVSPTVQMLSHPEDPIFRIFNSNIFTIVSKITSSYGFE